MNKQYISIVCVSLSCLIAQLAAEDSIDSQQVNEIAIDIQAVSEKQPDGVPLKETIEFTISPLDSNNLFTLAEVSKIQDISEEHKNCENGKDQDSGSDTLASQVIFDLQLPNTFIAMEQEAKPLSDENETSSTSIFCLVENINHLSEYNEEKLVESITAQEVVAIAEESVSCEDKQKKTEDRHNVAFGIVPAITTLAQNRVSANQPSRSSILAYDVVTVEENSEIASSDLDFDILVVDDEELVAVESGAIIGAADPILNHTIQVRAAAFFPASKRFREVYGHVGGNYQIEASTKIMAPLEAWVNADWYMRNRHIGNRHSSRVKIANLSLGLKYVHTFTYYLDVYLGAGPSFGWLSIHNRSWYISQRRSRYALGAVFKSGMRLYVTKNVFFDIFADYLAERVHFNNHHVQIGGLKTGLGVGVRF